MTDITDDILENVASLCVGNLRNGLVSNIVVSARESSIPPEYYYCIPLYEAIWSGDQGNFIPPVKAAVILNIAIRTYYAKICDADVVSQRNAFAITNPGEGFDEAAAWTIAKANEEFRKRAIAVGSAVTGVITSYRVERNDCNETEVGDTIYDLNAPTNITTDAAYRAACQEKNAGWKATLSSGNSGITLTELEKAAQEMTRLSAVEREASTILFVLGTAAISRAGATLIKTKHHYLSDSANRKRHLACETQVRQGESADVKAWFATFSDIWKDMTWHKSIHPVNVEVMEAIAADPNTAERLEASGYGSFAVGIPAQEDLISRAGSYVAVRNASRDDIFNAGHKVDYPTLVAMYSVFETMPKNIMGMVVPGWPGKPSAIAPTTITTRKEAVMHWLKPELEKVAARAAWIFGWYRGIAERMNINESSREGSLLKSYSLNKAMETHMPMAAQGKQAYSAWRRYINTMADKEEMVVYVYDDDEDAS